MSSYDKDINQVEKLMDKYKFKEPVPQEVRTHVIKSRKRIFKRILKTLGLLTIGYSIFMSVYFFLKKLGMTKLIASLVVATSVSTGTYVTIKYIQNKNAVKPVELHITPKEIKLVETNIVKNIKIITLLSNNKKRDIAQKAKTFIEPKELAVIQKKDNGFDIVFKKKGKGYLHVEWQKLKASVSLSYQPKDKPLNPLQKLYKKYKHTEKVLLADGSVFKGVLIDKGNGNIVFITPETTLKLKRSDIVKIEYLTPAKLK